jgi:hypothetical protein
MIDDLEASLAVLCAGLNNALPMPGKSLREWVRVLRGGLEAEDGEGVECCDTSNRSDGGAEEGATIAPPC